MDPIIRSPIIHHLRPLSVFTEEKTYHEGHDAREETLGTLPLETFVGVVRLAAES
jgi:hypothetical protein